MINIYNTNMKLSLIKFINFFLSFGLIVLLVSCSFLEYKEDKNNTKFSQNNIKKNKCPSIKIPSKTANFISSKKNILSIKKIEIACKSEVVAGNLNVLETVLQYKAKLELKNNNKPKEKEVILPSIYIALVDRENELVLAKMVSKIEISNKEDNLIVNKKKIRFKYASNKNLFIYFGLQ